LARLLKLTPGLVDDRSSPPAKMAFYAALFVSRIHQGGF